jgi:hypothetical protein
MPVPPPVTHATSPSKRLELISKLARDGSASAVGALARKDDEEYLNDIARSPDAARVPAPPARRARGF